MVQPSSHHLFLCNECFYSTKELPSTQSRGALEVGKRNWLVLMEFFLTRRAGTTDVEWWPSARKEKTLNLTRVLSGLFWEIWKACLHLGFGPQRDPSQEAGCTSPVSTWLGVHLHLHRFITCTRQYCWRVLTSPEATSDMRSHDLSVQVSPETSITTLGRVLFPSYARCAGQPYPTVFSLLLLVHSFAECKGFQECSGYVIAQKLVVK